MSNIEADGKHPKKNRKRLKRLYQQIREQVEFYLSDANLQKDRFFRQEMNNSPNGFIDLELFLRCNKIRAMTSDIDVLTSAVSTSKMLKVNKEEKKVARILPYTEPKDVDERTVYVEFLPSGIDREWIRNLFSSCGNVIYISLPRFKSTNDIKGFAFVEFETMEAACKACELMNHPPAEALEKVGRFPRSKQLKQLEKQVKIQETVVGRKRRASESEAVNLQPMIKRRRTFSDGKNSEVEPTLDVIHDSSTKQELHTSKRKRRKSLENLEIKEHQLSKSESKNATNSLKMGKAKREISTTHQSEEKSDQKNINKKAKLESDDTEPSSRPRQDSSKSLKKKDEIGETDISLETSQKRKANKEEMESSEKKVKRVKICEEPMNVGKKTDKEQKEDNDEQKTKRKRHKKNKNKTKTKDIPELRVISKMDWLKHRSEYLKIQKQNMTQLKEKLKQLKNDESKVNGNDMKSTSLHAPSEMDVINTGRKGDPEFIAGVIVKVTTDQSITRKDLKERIWAMGNIAYIDFKDGDNSGHIRCKDTETSSAISEMTLPGFTFQHLSGDEEQAYWQKLKDDRNKKLNTKTHSKQRGHDKILHKADIAYENMKKPLHVIFD